MGNGESFVSENSMLLKKVSRSGAVSCVFILWLLSSNLVLSLKSKDNQA